MNSVEIDPKRINRFLDQITAECADLCDILSHSDEEILSSDHLIKSCKYSIIVISEAMANALQHLLAKKYKIPISGYTEVLVKAGQQKILSQELLVRLRSFVNFRNLLVHQYWRVEDRQFIGNLRAGIDDFKEFIKEIRRCL